MSAIHAREYPQTLSPHPAQNKNSRRLAQTGDRIPQEGKNFLVRECFLQFLQAQGNILGGVRTRPIVLCLHNFPPRGGFFW